MASFSVNNSGDVASQTTYNVTVTATEQNIDPKRFLGTITYKTVDGEHEKTVKVYQDGASNFNPDSIESTKGVLVDLGLPSGTLWMDRNVGATSAEEVGNLYAWGETTTKASYTPSNYNPGSGDVTLYENSAYTTDSKVCNCLSGKPMFDPCQRFYGSTAAPKMCVRMPIYNQVHELFYSCDVTFTTTVNGAQGYLFVSKYNGNSIFIPKSSDRRYTSQAVGVLDNYCVIRVGGSSNHSGISGVFQSNGVNRIIPNGDGFSTYMGFPVRACTAGKFINLPSYQISSGNPRFQGIPITDKHNITSNDGWGHTNEGIDTEHTTGWVNETMEDRNVYKTVIISVFDPNNKGWYPVCNTNGLSFKVVARQYGQETVSETTTADASASDMLQANGKFVGNGYIEVTCRESVSHQVNNVVTLINKKGGTVEYDSFTFKYVLQRFDPDDPNQA